MEQEYLSPTEVAKILGISRQAVIERIKHGHLYAERVGNRYIVPKNTLAVKDAIPKKETAGNDTFGINKNARKEEIVANILERVRKGDIKTIQLWFVDILGIL
jgi:excisionase family DNA binding protein